MRRGQLFNLLAVARVVRRLRRTIVPVLIQAGQPGEEFLSRLLVLERVFPFDQVLQEPKAFELANKLTGIAPDGIDYAFFVNSGSEELRVTSLAVSPPFRLGASTLTVPAGSRGSVEVSFIPDAARDYKTSLMVRSNDPDVLTKDLPKDPDQVEALMGG